MSTDITLTQTNGSPVYALGRVQAGQPLYAAEGQKINRANPEESWCLSVPEWNFEYEAPAVQREDSDSELTVKAVLDANLSMVLHGSGTLLDDEFLAKSWSVDFEQEINSPRVCFMAATFSTLLQLARTTHDLPGGTVYIPPWGGPLRDISSALQGRQLAYKMMVAERALGVSFLLPPISTKREEKEAAFIYRAISERQFIAAFDREEFYLPANEKYARKLTEWSKAKSVVLAYGYKTELFSAEVSLGCFQVKIADALIENYDEAEQAMARQDGNPVPLVIRSLRGEAEWNFLDVPQLPPIIWEEKMQQLIALDRKLSDALADRYTAIVAATLDGLSEEDRIAVTKRPELDPEAFDR